jgi:hypothetical protein
MKICTYFALKEGYKSLQLVGLQLTEEEIFKIVFSQLNALVLKIKKKMIPDFTSIYLDFGHAKEDKTWENEAKKWKVWKSLFGYNFHSINR